MSSKGASSSVTATNTRCARRRASAGRIGDIVQVPRQPESTTTPTGFCRARSSAARPIRSRASSGRLRLGFEPSETFSGDVRLSYENLDTRGFYFVIPRDDEANPFSHLHDAAQRQRCHQPHPGRPDGHRRARPVDRSAAAQLRTGWRHADLGLGLQLHRGNHHRRRL